MSDDEKVNETEQEVLEQQEVTVEADEAPLEDEAANAEAAAFAEAQSLDAAEAEAQAVATEAEAVAAEAEAEAVAAEAEAEAEAEAVGGETADADSAEAGDAEGDFIDIEEPPTVETPESMGAGNSAADDRISDLELEIDLLNQKLKVKTDQLVRLAADFDNYKKRSKRDSEIEKASFAERLFTKLLPTLDSMDRAKQSVEDGDDLGHLRDGLSQIHSLFWAALKEVDVHPMDCVGKPFDPRFHEALMHHPMPGAEPNSVTVELQKGWVLGERVLRAARVGIAPDAPVATAEPAPVEESAPAQESQVPAVNDEGQPNDPLLDEAGEVVEDEQVELPDVEESTEPYEESDEAQDAGDDSSTSDGEDVSEEKEESED